MTLSGEVECDEVYLIAGHKGQPDKVKQAGRKPRKRRLKGARGRGTLANEKPPIFCMIQRSGEVVMRMLENVKQDTIKPLIIKSVAQGTQVYTDDYVIYSQLNAWGYPHKTVIIPKVNTPVMKTVMVFARCIPTPSKAFGLYSDLGYAHIAAFLKTNCLFT